MFKPNIEKLEQKRDVKRLVKALECKPGRKESSYMSIRRKAATALIDLNDPSAVPGLIHLVEKAPATYSLVGSEHESSKAAEEAIRVLGELGDNRALPVLIDALDKVFNPFDELHCAAVALGRIGDPAAIPYLRNALNSTSKSVREGAAMALETLRS